ncbi:MAG: hypothetical protein IPQ02_09095 [Saprospiraceae bacterium]|uniref:Uncharacterized protein n=1 Tax=Candidatus Defluviibacterium haderslevense TaxID=2981993 RepID=A0A9D7XDF1_9BACT|nr:hypothetical protein [Candidatus Defluviibacterium haderslevense]MBL0236748.1 hypothetical protein [Candidatus Defluviibacterium haderslevense]
MITKEKLLAQIESFPENISIDELIDRLIFIEKLENRILESEKEETISEEELKTIISKWSE